MEIVQLQSPIVMTAYAASVTVTDFQGPSAITVQVAESSPIVQSITRSSPIFEDETSG